MFCENKLHLVRTLTQAVVEMFAPHKLASFEAEFTPFALSGGAPQVQERLAVMRSRDRGLDTTLVAGMFFQVLVEAEQLPASTSERVSYVRKQAKNYLVNRLAGQISLSQFFRLLSLIDDQVQRYFSGLRSSWVRPSPEAFSPRILIKRPLTASGSKPCGRPWSTSLRSLADAENSLRISSWNSYGIPEAAFSSSSTWRPASR